MATASLTIRLARSGNGFRTGLAGRSAKNPIAARPSFEKPDQFAVSAKVSSAVMDEIGKNAAARGLTPAALESMLNDG